MEFSRTEQATNVPDGFDLGSYIPYDFELTVGNDPGPFSGQTGHARLCSDGSVTMTNYAAIQWYYAGLPVTSPDWPMLTLLLRCYRATE